MASFVGSERDPVGFGGGKNDICSLFQDTGIRRRKQTLREASPSFFKNNMGNTSVNLLRGLRVSVCVMATIMVLSIMRYLAGSHNTALTIPVAWPWPRNWKCPSTRAEQLVAMRDWLDSRQIPYFICTGTLLAAVRDQTFLPDDPDVDLCIPLGLSTEEEQRLRETQGGGVAPTIGMPSWTAWLCASHEGRIKEDPPCFHIPERTSPGCIKRVYSRAPFVERQWMYLTDDADNAFHQTQLPVRSYIDLYLIPYIKCPVRFTQPTAALLLLSFKFCACELCAPNIFHWYFAA